MSTEVRIYQPMSTSRSLWVGPALDDLRAFPVAVRRLAGYQLSRVQAGLMPNDWKPMTSVGAASWRSDCTPGPSTGCFYLAKFEEGIYVLHAFEKRTRQTRVVDIEVARKRRLAAATAPGGAHGTRTERDGKLGTRRSGRRRRGPPALAPRKPPSWSRARAEQGARGAGPYSGPSRQAAGLSQPRVSDLRRGKIDRFSIDYPGDHARARGCEG